MLAGFSTISFSQQEHQFIIYLTVIIYQKDMTSQTRFQDCMETNKNNYLGVILIGGYDNNLLIYH